MLGILAVIIIAFVAGSYVDHFFPTGTSDQISASTQTVFQQVTVTEVSVAYSTQTITLGGLPKFTLTESVIEEVYVFLLVHIHGNCTSRPLLEIYHTNSTSYNAPPISGYFNATVVIRTDFTTTAATISQSVSYCPTN